MRKPAWESYTELFGYRESLRFKKEFLSKYNLMAHNELIKDYVKTPGIVQGKYSIEPQLAAALTIFCHQGESVYKIGREFGEVLSDANLELSPDYFATNNQWLWVEYPDHIRFPLTYPGGEIYYAHGALVGLFNAPNSDKQKHFVMRDHEMDFQDSSSPPVSVPKLTLRDGRELRKYLLFFTPLFDKEEKLTWEVNCFKVPIAKNDKTMAEAIDFSEKSPYGEGEGELLPGSKAHHNYLVKCLAYIQSGDPDLRDYRAPKVPPLHGKKLRHWHKEQQNRSLIDMTLVGFNYKKPINYRVDATEVSGHWRWQPWGPRREKVKLIWIDSFIRKYHNEVKEEVHA